MRESLASRDRALETLRSVRREPGRYGARGASSGAGWSVSYDGEVTKSTSTGVVGADLSFSSTAGWPGRARPLRPGALSPSVPASSVQGDHEACDLGQYLPTVERNVLMGVGGDALKITASFTE